MNTSKYQTTVRGLVTEHVSEVLLGIDWLTENNADWNFRDESVNLNEYRHKLNTRPKDRKWCRTVVVQEDTDVTPRSEQNLGCRVMFHGASKSQPDQRCETEPAALRCGLLVARTLTPIDQFEDVPMRVLNLDDQPRRVKAGTVISDLEPVDVLGPMTADRAEDEYESSSNELPEHMRSLLEGVDENMPKEVAERLKLLMLKYYRIFSKGDEDIGLTDILSHRIDSGSARPIRQPLRKFPPAHVEAISAEVNKLLAQNVIEPAVSPWASSVVLVKKKDGSYRWCIDYRQLNSVTVKDAYPVPRTDSCLDAMAGSG